MISFFYTDECSVMFYMKLINFLIFILVSYSDANELPSWITSNKAFDKPTVIDSRESGYGFINQSYSGDSSWLITLNDDMGHGVEIELEQLSLDQDSDHYLLIAGWPIVTKSFRQIKLFTGNFKTSQKVHIPNTKKFFVLLAANEFQLSEKFILNYKRYGVSYEKTPSTTESPVKKKTIYEVQFRGRRPNDYDPSFVNKLKYAIRSTARTFSQIKGIPFDESKTLDEMVSIRRISFCPFEWPDREICASIEHSVFVSGLQGDGVIVDYELTSERLKEMWTMWNHPEIEKLGITVFRLPETYSTILWWTLFIGVVIGACLVGIIIFWKIEKHSKESRKLSAESVISTVKKNRKARLKPSKHQEIPSFMFTTNGLENEAIKFRDPGPKFVNNEDRFNKNGEQEKSEERAQTPMKSYFFCKMSSSEDELSSPATGNPIISVITRLQLEASKYVESQHSSKSTEYVIQKSTHPNHHNPQLIDWVKRCPGLISDFTTHGDQFLPVVPSCSQESVVVNDLISCLQGVSGRYVTANPFKKKKMKAEPFPSMTN